MIVSEIVQAPRTRRLVRAVIRRIMKVKLMKFHTILTTADSKEKKKTNTFFSFFIKYISHRFISHYTFPMNLDTLLHPLRSLFQKLEIQEESVFLTESETQWYLSQLVLTPWEQKILDTSFRTRSRKFANILEFQFRIRPEDLWEDERNDLQNIQIALKSKLSSLLPDQSIEVTIKLSDCCGKWCYGCRKYGQENTPLQ